MIIEQIFTDDAHRTFSYVIGDESSGLAAVFDPAFGHERIAAGLEANGLQVKYIIHTHGHYDHTGGTEDFRQQHGGEVVGHAGSDVDIAVLHEETLQLGELTLRFLETPGHTNDSICTVCGDHVITGDTLFVGKIGGTMTEDQARTEYRSLHEVLMQLDDHLQVWPGHDYGVAPSSTIGRERETNPFLLQPDFTAFLALKNNWDEYKRKHNIK